MVCNADELLCLKFVVVLKVSSATWKPTYVLPMKRVVLERSDVLEARIRDLEDALQVVKQQTSVELTGADAETGPVCLRVATLRPAPHNALLTWDHCNQHTDENNFTLDPSGNIQFRLPGLYQLNLIINHRNTSEALGAYELAKNGVHAQTGRGYDKRGALVSTCQSLILRLERGDELTVKYTGTQLAEVGSTMSALLLK